MAVLSAAIGAYAVWIYGEKESLQKRRRFATLRLPERDKLAETLLDETVRQIRNDTLFRQQWEATPDSSAPLRQYIQNKYLNQAFDRYQTEVFFFNPSQQALGKDSLRAEGSFADYVQNYQRIDYDTPFPDIFFIDKTGVNLIKRYLALITLKSRLDTLGYLVLDLRQNQSLPTNVYPELFVDKNYTEPKESKLYSYAVFEHRQLVYSHGDFNYGRSFPTLFLDEEALYFDKIRYEGYTHVAEEGGSKKIVVSVPVYDLWSVFSNFAFLFLWLVLIVVLFIVIYSLVNRLQGLRVSFATRIQFYLNIAFFLPLFTVSLTILSIISGNYRQDFALRFQEDTQQAGRNLLPHLERYVNGQSGADDIRQANAEIARHIGRDVNVFDRMGHLITSSQPAIYETHTLAPYLNAEALDALRFRGETVVMLRESVGKLNYQTVTVPLKSYENGRLLGFVSIPFFVFTYELEKRLVDVLSIIINIFSTILIIFLILSYFASQILTVPLRLITQKIRKTSFYDYNAPLEWNSHDEIGLFVREYNRMLKKLDKSKEALARTQRETAWREIAQQVAHEIKNPLTPIRLTLQMMQKRLEAQGEKVKAIFERPIDTLLEQADVLNDIATSFSSFAKMPIPASERFEITELIYSTESLYASQAVELKLKVPAQKFYIRGDRKLMGRILST
ncbi:MAG: hypothetical protein HC913_14130 [Microscillaceae bacterium]|nr:hypothetical protein [Microscillaceae bacterium]